MNIAKNLLKYRKLYGLTHDQVALAIGKDRTSYTKYETGKATPPIESLVKLSQMFEIPLMELLGVKDEPDENAEQADGKIRPLSARNKDEKSMLIFFRSLTDEQKQDCLSRLEGECKRSVNKV